MQQHDQLPGHSIHGLNRIRLVRLVRVGVPVPARQSMQPKGGVQHEPVLRWSGNGRRLEKRGLHSTLLGE